MKKFIKIGGGHNEDAGRALAQSMAELEDKMQRPLVIVCGSLASKDTGGFLRAFKGLAQEVVAVPVNADQYAKPAAEVAAGRHRQWDPRGGLRERQIGACVSRRATMACT